jgi:glycosyltransferase involved in cell wall biosynthesis
LQALSVIAKRTPEVEICLFGADHIPGHLAFPHTALGILSPTELGDLYRGCDIGLAFSTTNPSLVTFEMMACGLPLVDLDVFDARARHGGYPAVLAEPSPEKIADAVTRLLASPGLRSDISRDSIAFTASMPNAQEALGRISTILEEEIGRTDTSNRRPLEGSVSA